MNYFNVNIVIQFILLSPYIIRVMQNDNGDYSKRLFDLYESNSGNFQKVFAIVVGFGLLFLFTALFPYFSNQFEQYERNIQIKKETGTIMDENATINILEKKISSVAGEIGMTKKISNTIKLNMKQEIVSVNKTLSAAQKLISQINDQQILAKLKQMYNNTSSAQKRVLNFVISSLDTYQHEYSSYQKRLSDLKNNLTALQNEKKNEYRNLTSDIGSETTLKGRLNNLTARWNEINSPIGNFPIQFVDLIAVFPLSLAGGFMICSIFLSESIRLRRVLHFIYLRKGIDGGIINDQKIYLIAPLWIDPINPGQNKIVHFSVLLLPFIIFIVSLGMILYSWYAITFDSSNGPFLAANNLNKTIYGFLYVLSFGVFVYSVWRIVKDLRRYSNGLPSHSEIDPGKKGGISNG